MSLSEFLTKQARECCIHNEYGGGGCGPCDRGAGPELELSDFLTKMAAMMTQTQFAKWQQYQRIEPEYEKVGRQWHVKNLDKIAVPLNDDQYQDVKTELRVAHEDGLQRWVDRQNTEQNVISSEDALWHSMAGREFHTDVMGIKGAATVDLWHLRQSPNEYNPPAKNWRELYGIPKEQSIGQRVNYGYEYHKIVESQREEIGSVIARRYSQVATAEQEVKAEFQADVESGELHVDDNGNLVNKSLGDISTKEARDTGKIEGVPNGGIRGITTKGNILQKGQQLPTGEGGHNECCIYNNYGGGGCGPCDRGAGPTLKVGPILKSKTLKIPKIENITPAVEQALEYKLSSESKTGIAKNARVTFEDRLQSSISENWTEKGISKTQLERHALEVTHERYQKGELYEEHTSSLQSIAYDDRLPAAIQNLAQEKVDSIKEQITRTIDIEGSKLVDDVRKDKIHIDSSGNAYRETSNKELVTRLGQPSNVMSKKDAGVGGDECCIFNEHGGGGCGPCNRGAGPELELSDFLTKSAAFQKQEAKPLTETQLSDLHAAMRVKTEDRMEQDISDALYRRPPSSDPIERYEHVEKTGQDFITMSPKTTEYGIRSIREDDPKGYLIDVLMTSQQGKIHREINEDTGEEKSVTDTPLVDQYKGIVNRDLHEQYNANELSKSYSWEKRNTLQIAIAQREAQVDNEYGLVITEIRDEIEKEKLDVDTDGQIISERFGWRSASEAMATGDYGQPNGNIRGVTDPENKFVSANQVVGGSGECCIYNEYGGGGCGPCDRGAGPVLELSDFLTKSARIGELDPELDITDRWARKSTRLGMTDFLLTRSHSQLAGINITKGLNKAQMGDMKAGMRSIAEQELENAILNKSVHVPVPRGYRANEDTPKFSTMGGQDYFTPPKAIQELALSNINLKEEFANNQSRISETIQQYYKDAVTKNLGGYSPVYLKRLGQVEIASVDVLNEMDKDIESGELYMYEDGSLGNKRFGGLSAREARIEGKFGQTNLGIRGITGTIEFKDVGGQGTGECCIYNEYGGGGCGPCNR